MPDYAQRGCRPSEDAPVIEEDEAVSNSALGVDVARVSDAAQESMGDL